MAGDSNGVDSNVLGVFGRRGYSVRHRDRNAHLEC